MCQKSKKTPNELVDAASAIWPRPLENGYSDSVHPTPASLAEVAQAARRAMEDSQAQEVRDSIIWANVSTLPLPGNDSGADPLKLISTYR